MPISSVLDSQSSESSATAAVPEVLLRAQGLGKTVMLPAGPLVILEGLDCSVSAGESLAILGASGSGKSTLLALLAGLDVPTLGEVWLAGEPLSSLDEDGRAALRARVAGFVFQSFHLLPAYTALENVMLPLELQGAPDARRRAQAALDEVGLGERGDQRPRTLSGGEQQRVALARALVTRPRILFADEPTGNLDTRTGERIMALMFDLNARHGTTLVLVTHDPSLATRCARELRL
ncbi:MAG: ATP-binding cassette domain-containing protein [Pseudomonadota bacterium]|nr:ATP-binding cassette domain-containing protein [Pseudomonadota bacterium]